MTPLSSLFIALVEFSEPLPRTGECGEFDATLTRWAVQFGELPLFAGDADPELDGFAGILVSANPETGLWTLFTGRVPEGSDPGELCAQVFGVGGQIVYPLQ